MTIAPGHIVTQERELYRVDGYLVDPGAIPAETLVPFELEMQCYKQPDWHHLKKVPPCLDCDDYQNSGWGCVPGTGDYNNADSQDEETDVSICSSWPEYDFPVAGVDDYENADVQPRGGGNPGDCI